MSTNSAVDQLRWLDINEIHRGYPLGMHRFLSPHSRTVSSWNYIGDFTDRALASFFHITFLGDGGGTVVVVVVKIV